MQTIPYHSEKRLNSNGIELNYDSFGDPSHPPILLIMGLATQMIYWQEDFCRMLAQEGFWVIRFDNRDVGKSSWLENQTKPSVFKLAANALFNKPVGAAYLLDDMVNDTIGLLDSLNIKKCHLVGASMGGMIAQALAIKAPNRIFSLTSIMSTTGNRKLPKPSLGFSLKVMSRPPKDKKQFVPYGLNIWRALHGQYYAFDQQKITSLISQSIQRGINLDGSARQLAAILDAPDRTPQLTQLNIPSLILHGEDDPLVPVAAGYATAKAIPNAKLKTYKGMGHTIPSELYVDICQQIVEHCQQATAKTDIT